MQKNKIKILFVKGNSKIIRRVKYKDRSKIFYDFIIDLFSNKKFHFQKARPENHNNLSQKIKKADILIGHSLGANWIAKHFNPKKYPETKQIILFDPDRSCMRNWNRWKTNKIIFVSTKYPYKKYKGLKNLTICKGDHYFAASHKKIRDLVKKLTKNI